MVDVTFPDGASRQFDPGISGLDIAKSISPSLAKRSVAMTIDGALVDLASPIEHDAKIEFVSRDDPRRWSSYVTTPRMFWPRPYRSCIRARRSPSAP